MNILTVENKTTLQSQNFRHQSPSDGSHIPGQQRPQLQHSKSPKPHNIYSHHVTLQLLVATCCL